MNLSSRKLSIVSAAISNLYIGLLVNVYLNAISPRISISKLALDPSIKLFAKVPAIILS